MKKINTHDDRQRQIDDTLQALHQLRDELVQLSLAMKDAEFENDVAGRQQAMALTARWLTKISGR